MMQPFKSINKYLIDVHAGTTLLRTLHGASPRPAPQPGTWATRARPQPATTPPARASASPPSPSRPPSHPHVPGQKESPAAGAGICPTLLKRDLLVVHATTSGRQPLVEASSRTWRVGVPAFIVTNGSAVGPLAGTGVPPYPLPPGTPAGLEAWWTYPGQTVYSEVFAVSEGENRMLAAVQLARAHAPTDWEWMLYGDDDTVWHVDAALGLLCGLNATVPFYFSDVGNEACGHQLVPFKACALPGTPGLRRRLPAGTAMPDGSVTTEEGECLLHPDAAPCTMDALEGKDPAFRLCPVALKPGIVDFIGGSGTILSRGLVDAIPEAAFQELLKETHKQGDYLVLRAIQQARRARGRARLRVPIPSTFAQGSPPTRPAGSPPPAPAGGPRRRRGPHRAGAARRHRRGLGRPEGTARLPLRV